MTSIPFLDLSKVNAPLMPKITEAITRVATGGRYIGGSENEAFERRMTEITGGGFCVGVSNGLDALRLILEGYKRLGILKTGDGVIVPANTYIASVLAVSHAGLTPIPVEPDATTLNIDSKLIEKALTPTTRAIMTVHLYGRTAWDDTLEQIARRHNLIVIEDCAQSIGASFTDGRCTGALGHAAAFSFYPTKNIGAIGDAGAVTTSSKELADAVRALANYGSDRRYHNIYQGFNCRLDPIQAAVLNVKLSDEHLNSVKSRRNEIARIYNSTINTAAVTLPEMPEQSDCHVWHQYVVMCDRRDLLKQHLADNGIATDIHYATPPHRQPCYMESFSGYKFPITDYIADHCLSLPVNEALTTDEALAISSAINRCFK